MNRTKLFLFGLLLAGGLGWSAIPASAQEGLLLKVELSPGSNYCHLQFPAMRPETLAWDKPVLKDPSSGDIVDFYGPCDQDPTGKAEVAAQTAQVVRETLEGEGGED